MAIGCVGPICVLTHHESLDSQISERDQLFRTFPEQLSSSAVTLLSNSQTLRSVKSSNENREGLSITPSFGDNGVQS